MSSERFPSSLLAAIRYFEDEAACRDFLAGLRWPNGVVCLFCRSDKVGHIGTRSLWRCKDCRRQFSLKKGTIFEDSPIPLSKWLPVVWLYSAGKKGRSSHQLARDLGITQKSAWFMSHRIRLAMETESFDGPLSGEVDGGEINLGGHDRNKHAHIRRVSWGKQVAKAAAMGLLEVVATYERRLPSLAAVPFSKRRSTATWLPALSFTPMPLRSIPTAWRPTSSARSSTALRTTFAGASIPMATRTFGLFQAHDLRYPSRLRAVAS
ncbi:MAG: IS1595 family transposase [Acidimicrobiales bacterium]